MSIEEIITTHNQLEQELQLALCTMERKDTIRKIRMRIIENQQRCPHSSDKYNWIPTAGRCPYCGFIFNEGEDI